MLQLNWNQMVISNAKLDNAIGDLYREFTLFGIQHVIDNTDVTLSLFGIYFGYYNPDDAGKPGLITIPRVSFLRLTALAWGYQPYSLRHILRHEYGHAIAYQYRRLMRSAQFREAFGLHHEKEAESKYSKGSHVTEYAAHRPYEDFAETFAMFVKHKGYIPSFWNTEDIARKWNFVDRLCDKVKTNQKSW